MQENKGYKMIMDEMIQALSNHFADRVKDFALAPGYMDAPYTEFRMEFVLYKFFKVVLDYDRGRLGCCLPGDNIVFPLENSQKWFDEADLNVFCTELDEQIRLRIPDKYLAYFGWE